MTEIGIEIEEMVVVAAMVHLCIHLHIMDLDAMGMRTISVVVETVGMMTIHVVNPRSHITMVEPPAVEMGAHPHHHLLLRIMAPMDQISWAMDYPHPVAP